jgi:predicted RND superfamily exporter protein
MFSKKKIDVEMVKAQNADEAMNFIFAGTKYFLVKHTIKTAVVILILLGGALYMVADYWGKAQRAKSHIERTIKP